jgi:VIT1/CCC1 family predicted Fe2+/Mn2+ transporter
MANEDSADLHREPHPVLDAELAAIRFQYEEHDRWLTKHSFAHRHFVPFALTSAALFITGVIGFMVTAFWLSTPSVVQLLCLSLAYVGLFGIVFAYARGSTRTAWGAVFKIAAAVAVIVVGMVAFNGLLHLLS